FSTSIRTRTACDPRRDLGQSVSLYRIRNDRRRGARSCVRDARGAPMSARYFGARVARVEDPDLLTGRGRYLDDIEVPGTLEGAFVRSPHAHARIRADRQGS